MHLPSYHTFPPTYPTLYIESISNPSPSIIPLTHSLTYRTKSTQPNPTQPSKSQIPTPKSYFHYHQPFIRLSESQPGPFN
ncbi:hypothetical protein BO70DRAFT_362983 [Aspergillus heteromorphus CBS 117.55]|uniref:Uncharacterized protein n=1 Tax=Aspergillus heteromorphus CBS 117.55 TaxID=1448321 RepID=A0A317W0U3_9EURO|nr:uncharacterized protein BO70DRAFT_362983 [Aspergillus heteromorphus CBS 117.55]PWY79221.1 hypothetical protein BO70DRAFT_362983 [Aspergillus heteromorphus CBS 117.55]